MIGKDIKQIPYSDSAILVGDFESLILQSNVNVPS